MLEKKGSHRTSRGAEKGICNDTEREIKLILLLSEKTRAITASVAKTVGATKRDHEILAASKVKVQQVLYQRIASIVT